MLGLTGFFIRDASLQLFCKIGKRGIVSGVALLLEKVEHGSAVEQAMEL
jgi:hypothetical protein